MSIKNMVPFTNDELIEIDTLVNKVRGRIFPNQSAIRELSVIFKTRVRDIDIKCSKCIGHMIEYFHTQCEKKK